MGFHQHQRAFVQHHGGRALARHADGLWLGGNRCLYGGDFFSIRVHPLQARRSGHLVQRIERQREALDAGHALGRCRCRRCGRRR
jgi:hypothetical protein